MALQVIIEGIINGAIIALVAIGIALIWGVMGLLCFAQGEFLMIGMYAAYFLHRNAGLDPIISLPLCAALLFIIGFVIYHIMVRRVLTGPPLSQRLLTFGLSMLLANLALYFFKGDYRTITDTELLFHGNLSFLGVSVSINKVIPLIVCILLTGILYLFLNHTRHGKAIQAVSMDKDAAALVGINCDNTYATAFGVSCAITGAAGSILTYYYYIFPSVGTTFQLFGFIAVALGGFGSVIGAFLGGLLMGLIDTGTGVVFNTAFKYLFVCVAYVLVVTFRPKGLFGK